ncbi:FGGY-family carbohydrate kinase [Micromonospora sagamiensis]|uniref:Xylulokinase n=1 Tax=Micromonospora sagamiensis TaxID=47875 RepID=A0A562WG12_9ACTN|nr:FGGY family carbohydrate kinase [Micromonospora sagamiensis]TWJ28847.1 xylulokinase [Micromonospora sagamiensis]BCL18126.1 sugar kinase [Micromonospora sagamiensis]
MAGGTRGPTLLAGVDVGTTHTKAGVYRADGTPVAQRQAATPPDAEGLRDTALRLLAECVSAAPVPPVAVGLASMAETGVPLDAGGEPIGELLHWRDRRAHREADHLAETVGRAPFFGATGLHPSAKLPLARWIWLRRHDPDRTRRMARWASSADLVLAALTGTVATSPTLAARTGAFDIRAMAYASDLLDLAGLRPDQMPPVVATDRVAGRVTPAMATRTGLPAGTPVVLAGHDHLAAAWAAGVRGPGRTADSMGTAEAVLTPVAAVPPMPATPTGISVGPFLDGRSYCLISGLSSSGGLVDWWLARFAPPDCPDRYRWFTDLVGATTDRPPTGITVLPYLHGRASPQPEPHRTLSFHGVRPEHDLADLGRAVLEGLCMQVRWMLESQVATSGHRPDAVAVFGGPTANPTWMRIKAAVMPVPVVVLPDHRSAVLGAAQLAGRAIGVEDGPSDPPPPRPAAAPDPAWETAYRTRFLPLATSPDPSGSEETP